MSHRRRSANGGRRGMCPAGTNPRSARLSRCDGSDCSRQRRRRCGDVVALARAGGPPRIRMPAIVSGRDIVRLRARRPFEGTAAVFARCFFATALSIPGAAVSTRFAAAVSSVAVGTLPVWFAGASDAVPGTVHPYPALARRIASLPALIAARAEASARLCCRMASAPSRRDLSPIMTSGRGAGRTCRLGFE